MKSILLIIFLLPLTVIGQVSNNGIGFQKAHPIISANHDTIGNVYLGNYAGHYTVTRTINIYDTIPCVLLVSDSTIANNNKVVWIKGWEVREVLESFFSYEGKSVHDYNHIEYLDIIKNKLSRNIIVWQSKNN